MTVGLDWFSRDQVPGAWDQRPGRSLADQRVLIAGYGHFGAAIEARLQGFEVGLSTGRITAAVPCASAPADLPAGPSRHRAWCRQPA